MIGEGISSRVKARQKAKEAETDSLDLATLVKRGKKNFIAKSTDFIEARIEPAPIFNTHGENCGRLKVLLRGDRKFTFQFEAIEDMKFAIEQLPRLL